MMLAFVLIFKNVIFFKKKFNYKPKCNWYCVNIHIKAFANQQYFFSFPWLALVGSVGLYSLHLFSKGDLPYVPS